MRVPEFLYLTITRECNLRCRQCYFWTYKDPEDKLNINEFKNIIDQFCEINPSPVVVINGGEPTIHRDEFFEISQYLRSKTITSTCVTNGYAFDDYMVENMIDVGPRYITVSLDSHIREIHNFLRGTSDAFDSTVDTIKRLIKMRNSKKDFISEITVSTIIFDENVEYLPDYIEFVRGLGVNAVLFQILSPTFANVSKTDKFFSEHFFKNNAIKAIETIFNVYEKYKNDPFVQLSRSDVEWYKMYIENPDFVASPVCDSHNRNIFLELCGDIVLCAHMRNFNNGRSIGNIREKRLKDIINSESAQKMREIMSRCRKNCALLACHRKKD